MSEAMQQAILRMPPECWRNEEPLDVGQRHSAYVAAADRLLELERENAALREDKARLDFLQRVAEEGGFQCFGIEDSALLDFEFSNRENETSDSVRAAIDAARAKEGQS